MTVSPKIEAIYQRWQRGSTDGERGAAYTILVAQLQKQGITIDQFMAEMQRRDEAQKEAQRQRHEWAKATYGDLLEWHKFGYGTAYEKDFMELAIRSVLGTFTYRTEKRKRHFEVKVSKAQKLRIMSRYKNMKRRFEHKINLASLDVQSEFMRSDWS